MLKVLQTIGTSVEDGKIILWVLGADQKKYGIALLPLAAAQVVTTILQAAKDLPPDQQVTTEGVTLPGSLSLAYGERMQPMVAVQLGGLEFAMPMSEAQLKELRDEISRLLEPDGTRH